MDLRERQALDRYLTPDQPEEGWRCENCNWKGDSPDEEEIEERHEAWGSPFITSATYRTCPKCGSDHLEECQW